MNPIKGIVNRATLDNNSNLNILTFTTHSPYEATLANQFPKYKFYAYRDEGIIPDWNPVRDKPDNYILLDYKKGDASIPPYVDFHLILCQNVAAQYKYAERYSHMMGIPILNVVHTMPPMGFTKEYLDSYKKINVVENIFITEYSREIWGFDKSNSTVIYHGIEDDIYYSTRNVRRIVEDRRPRYIMTLANEYEQRWRELGFDLYTKIIPGLQAKHFGSSAGGQLPNNPVNTTEKVVHEINNCAVYLNTSRYSPIPRSLCEAMMCGAPIVTSNGSAIPELLTHEYDCLMFPLDKPELGKKYCEHLLRNPSEAIALGNNARKTAQKLFNVNRFKEQFSNVFTKAVKS